MIGLPEISTDGFLPYKNAIRAAFGNRIAHGVINKTYQRNPPGRKGSGAALFAGRGSSRRDVK